MLRTSPSQTSPWCSRHVAVVGLICALALPARTDPPDLTVMVEMRDGVHLATDVYLPPGDGPWPVILKRTPYDRLGLASAALSQNAIGRAFVAQDVRGRCGSEGEFMPFFSDGWGTEQDGYDSVEWIAAQPWCDGHISMRGASALGMAGFFAAGAAPPSLTSIYASEAESDLHRAIYTGGVFRRRLVQGWLWQMDALDLLPIYAAHPLHDEWWAATALPDRWESVNVPIYQHSGWFDIFHSSQVETAVALNALGGPGAQGRQLLVVGPWTHTGIGNTVQGELTFPANAVGSSLESVWIVDFNRELLRGEDTGVFDYPMILYYLMGDVDDLFAPGNVWLTTEQWPPENNPVTYHLQSEGGLSTAPSTGQELTTSYVSDPNDPVPTRGGNNLFVAAGPHDQQALEARDDVLTFSTPPLDEPLAIIGPITCRLFVSSTAPDADFLVKLCDVYPDGRSMLMAEGALRARHRVGLDQEELMIPSQVCELDIFVGHLALVINAGHQLRLSIASTNWPRFEVNPQTGDPFTLDDPERRVATHTIHHSADHPSGVTLPLYQGKIPPNPSTPAELTVFAVAD